MHVIINPSRSVKGEIVAPPSKSYSHRAFIAASLANGVSVIKNPLTSGDVQVTMNILKDLRVKILEMSNNSYVVEGGEDVFKPVYKTLNCKNSGTTFRIFSALSLLIEGGLTLSGEFLKRNRPIIPLLEALKKLGADYKISKDKIHIERMQKVCNSIEIPGDISSQFITALLFASPKLTCSNAKFIDIQVKTKIVSYPYIKITLDVLKAFNINILESLDAEIGGKFIINANQYFRPQIYEIPGDFSSAAFIMAASVLSPDPSNVVINNLNLNNPQGDKRIFDILKTMGATIECDQEKNSISIQGSLKKNPLNGIDIDCSQIPDLFPILSVIGAFALGKTTLYNAGNLRQKESDRISIMARELTKMGVKVEEEDDKLTIHHCNELNGINVQHEQDHRIAMALTIAALFAGSESQLEDAEIIQDSYPQFLQDLKQLNAKITEKE